MRIRFKSITKREKFPWYKFPALVYILYESVCVYVLTCTYVCIYVCMLGIKASGRISIKGILSSSIGTERKQEKRIR